MTPDTSRPRHDISLDLVNVIVLSIGADGRIESINRKGCELLGRTATELVGADWFGTCLPPEVAAETRTVFKRLMAGELETSAYHENELLTATGERRLIAWHNSFLRDESGAITRTISAGEDITRRRAQEEALQSSHEQFLAVLDNLPAAVYVGDMESYELLFVNRIARQAGPEVAVGATCWKVLKTEQERPCEFCTNDQLVNADGEPAAPVEWEFENTVNGRWYQCVDSAIRWVDGRLVRLEIAYDITDKRNLEQERAALERQRQLSRQMESLGALTGGLAHDFNNILLAVQGNAELAREQLVPEHPANAFLADVLRASRRASDLCHQMLLYAGRTEPVKVSLGLGDLVDEMVRLLGVSIPDEAEIEVDIAPDMPAIEADPTQVRQVIMNLVTNAAEALHRAGGNIAVRVRRETLQGAGLVCRNCHELIPDGDYVVLEVEDDGQGMTPETLDRLYEPFYSTKFTGRGLGLSVVRGVVASHDSHMTVVSQSGAGSRFRIYFETQGKPAVALTNSLPEPGLDVAGAKGVVLLVDDEDDVRAVARRMLERLGCDVTEVGGGREALARLTDEGSWRPDAVLLDATMPGMDGMETMRRIHALAPDLKVILTSGHPLESLLTNPGDRQPDQYLAKPYAVTDLAAALEAVLPPA